MIRRTTEPSAGPGEHAVQFYQGDDELTAVVGAYLADGIRSGGSVIVAATARHRRAFEAALAEAGVDVAKARAAGRLLIEDAAELLGRFLGGGGLDHGRFRSVLSGLIRRAAAGGRHVRIYGEMVAVLWGGGHFALANELEMLWNRLATVVPFALLCGYPDHPEPSGDAGDAVREVRGLHSEVIATRSFLAELDSVRQARHFAAGQLDQEAGEELGADAAIVVTELAANAVLHAQSGFTLTISQSAAAVRIAVRDDRPVATGNDGVPFDVKTGHGLSVVAQLASEWAVDRLPDGKVVWAELPAR